MRRRHRKAIRAAIEILAREAQNTFDANVYPDGKIHDLDSRREYRRFKRAAKRLREVFP